jgi:uncharacterized protein (UPF0297 family)
MNDKFSQTTQFSELGKTGGPREIIMSVYNSLSEKGYRPINQLVGYIMSGDPSYITAHGGARGLIQRLERDEILEEIIKFYVENR